MVRLLFSALALLACACAQSATIDEIQRAKRNPALGMMPGLQRGHAGVDKRPSVPDPLRKAASEAGTAPNSTLFRYDADGNLVGEIVDAGTPHEQRITYAVDKQSNPTVIVAEAVNGRVTRSYHWEFGNELQSFTDHLPDGSTRTYLAQLDGQGSIRALTDLQGNVTDTFTYEANGSVVARTGNTDLRFLFRGEHMNDRTGWYHLRARWMDPSAGRFVSQDPFRGFDQDPKSLHRYMYAHNDPINNLDPSGLFTLTELSVASNIRTTLGNLQSDFGLNLMDGVMSRGESGASGWGYIASMVPFVGGGLKWLSRGLTEVRLGRGVLRYSSKTPPLPKEIDAASFIASQTGAKIYLRGKGVKGADAMIDGVKWEFKTLEVATNNAVANNIKKAVRTQSSRVVIDGRAVGLTEDAVNAGIARAARDGYSATELMVLLPGDKILRF